MFSPKKILSVVSVGFLLMAAYFFTKEPSYPYSYEASVETGKINFSGSHDFSGATMVNLDEEADLEIFISEYGGSGLLLKRSGNQFNPIRIPELQDPNGLTFSVTACDLDQDGRDEILLLNRPNQVTKKSFGRIVKYSDGKWLDLIKANDPLLTKLERGYSSSCIDRKGDGHYGLVVTSEEGKLSYLEMVAGQILDQAESIGLGLSSKGRSVMGIPDARGPTNIFVGNHDGANFYFVNNGEGLFTENAEKSGLSDPLFDARGISIIDANHDDIPDVVYGNNLGPTRLLIQKRDGKFDDVTPKDMKGAYAVNSAVVGDFNLDGEQDIYLNNIRGGNALFVRHKDEWFKLNVETMAEDDMYGISTITGDLDANGSYDILNTHGDGSRFPVTLYSVKPKNDWIRFSPRNQNGGIPRGAVVKVRTNLRDHLYVISTGSGRFANDDYDVLLGLNKDELVQQVEVTLPSGKKIEFKQEFSPLKKHNLIIP